MPLRQVGLTLTLTAVSLIGIFLFPWYWVQLTTSLFLMGWLPGYTLLTSLKLDLLTRPETLLLSLPTSYALTTILLMGFVFGGIPLTTLTLAVGLSGLILGSLALSYRPKPSTVIPQDKVKTTPFYWLIALILVALFFRTYRVHYSDYQGDEAGILLQAISLFQGDGEALMERFKGPGEVLILVAIGGLTDNFSELTGRLPFSMASAAAVGLIFLLGVQLFNPYVGFAAAALASIEGVFVSYARTAQYQNVLLVISLAAIFCFYRAYQVDNQSRRLHGLAAFMLGVACLFHFEALFLVPLAAYLILADLFPKPHLSHSQELHKTSAERRPGLSKSGSTGLTYVNSEALSALIRACASRLLNLWPAVMIFITITASFYIPFLLHPNLGDTGGYLENRIASGDSLPFNNFDHFFYREALKYNSIYYTILFNLSMMGVGLIALGQALPAYNFSWLKRKNSYSAVAISLIIIVGMGSLLAVLGWFRLSAGLVGLSVGVLVLLITLSPATSPPQRLLWLWIAPAAWVYLFLVNRPGKHHYLFWSALLILVGVAIVWLVKLLYDYPTFRWLKSIAFVTIGLAMWLIFANYTTMLLLRTDLEYMLTYPEHKSQFYPVDAAYPYRTRIGFGYPYRLGWQVIGQLKRNGQLEGSWAANDEGNALRWYMQGQPQTKCYPQHIIRSEITFKGDDLPLPFQPENFGYATHYRVWGNDRLRLTVQTFDPDGLITEPHNLYETDWFSRSISPADFMPLQHSTANLLLPQITLEPALVLGEGSEIKINAPADYLERAQQLAGRVRLLGYEAETDYQTSLPLNLYWQTEATLSLRYKVFIHLLDPQGQLVAQADDFPVCGRSHANSWPPGSIVVDRHLLKLPTDLVEGEYHLRIGMYEPDLNLRLNYFDTMGNEQGNYLPIELFPLELGS